MATTLYFTDTGTLAPYHAPTSWGPTINVAGGESFILASTLTTLAFKNPFTLSGTVSVGVYASETAMTTNAGLAISLLRVRSGVETTIASMVADGVELSVFTTYSTMTWNVTPTSTDFIAGDYLRAKLYVVPVGTLGAGTVYTMSSPANPSYITLTETIDYVSDGVGSYVGGYDASSGGDYVMRFLPSIEFTGITATRFPYAVQQQFGFANSTNGYTGGGFNRTASTIVSTLHRLPHASEAITSLAATLSIAHRNGGSSESSTVGYAFGGTTTTSSTPRTAEIDGMTFSSETSTNPTAALPSAQDYGVCTKSSTDAYHSLSFDGSVYVSAVARFAFSTETVTNSVATLTAATYHTFALQSDTKGYFCGGSGTGNGRYVRSLNFSTLAVAANSTGMYSTQRDGGMFSFELAGYMLEGISSETSFTYTANVQKLVFSTETGASVMQTYNGYPHADGCSFTRPYVAQPKTHNATAAPSGAGTVAALGLRGALGAASVGGAGTLTSTAQVTGTGVVAGTATLVGAGALSALWVVQRLAAATLSGAATLVANAKALNSKENVYITGSGTTTLYGFHPETNSLYATSYTIGNQYTSGSFASSSAGYFTDSSPYASLSASRITFSTKSTATVSNVKAAVSHSTGNLVSSSAAYRTGGSDNDGYKATVEKFVFSTETASMLSATLASAAEGSGTVSFAEAGYIYLGGGATGYTSKLQRLTFSSEAVTDLLGADSYVLSPTGIETKAYGYFCGGLQLYSALASIAKLTLSTEALSSMGQVLGEGVWGAVGASALSAGYIFGGRNYAGTWYDKARSLEFSTEAYTSPVATLTGIGNNGGAVIHRNVYGGSAQASAAGSLAAVPRPSQLHTAQATLGAIGQLGILIGAGTIHEASTTLVGSSTAVVSANFRQYSGGVGAYHGGSISGAATAGVSYLYFASETVETSVAALSAARTSAGGISAPRHGYVFGGYVEEKLDYFTGVVSPVNVTFVSYASSAAVSDSTAGHLRGVSGGLSLRFPTETVAANGWLDTAFSWANTATTQSRTHGYVLAGSGRRDPSGAIYLPTVAYAMASDTVLVTGAEYLDSEDGETDAWASASETEGHALWVKPDTSAHIRTLNFASETFSVTAQAVGYNSMGGGVATTSGIAGYASTRMGTNAPVVAKLTFATRTLSTLFTAQTYFSLTAAATELNPSSEGGKVTFRARGDVDVVQARVRSAGGEAFFAGGLSGSSVLASIEVLEFDTECVFESAASLATGRTALAGTQSAYRGYYAGGGGSGEVDGVQFADETRVNPSAALVTARGYLAGVSSDTKGYYAGGTAAGITAEIDCVAFATETTADISAALSVPREGVTAAKSSTKGYFAGGDAGAAFSADIDGINLSTEAAVNPSAALSRARAGASGMQSSSAGYFTFGHDESGIYGQIEEWEMIDKLQFSNESMSVPTATTSKQRYGGAASSSTAGYVGYGISDSAFATNSPNYMVYRISFSNDSVGQAYAAGVSPRAMPASVTCASYAFPPSPKIEYAAATAHISGGMQASSRMAHAGVASATAYGTLGILPSGVWTARAMLSGLGGLSARPYTVMLASGSLVAGGGLSVGASMRQLGAAALVGGSGLAVLAMRTVVGVGKLNGSGAAVPTANRIVVGKGALAGSGTVAAAGRALYPVWKDTSTAPPVAVLPLELNLAVLTADTPILLP